MNTFTLSNLVASARAAAFTVDVLNSTADVGAELSGPVGETWRTVYGMAKSNPALVGLAHGSPERALAVALVAGSISRPPAKDGTLLPARAGAKIGQILDGHRGR